ncbi:MAG TPA: hypothetical protein P5077_03420 [bacterium]|nr:hypothetical protein [bacterium]
MGQDTGGRDPQKHRFMGRLKLYKKPKPIPQIPQEPLPDMGSLSFPSASETPPPRVERPAIMKRRSLIAFAVLFFVLMALTAYIFYEPAPPDVIGPRNRDTLLPACRGGNGVACGEVALLEYMGLSEVTGDIGEKGRNPANAFIYGRLACAKRSAFGCYLMWRLWTKKETELLKPQSAEETLRNGCKAGNKMLCGLEKRFAGTRDIAPQDLQATIADATDGKNQPRYAKDNREQLLFELFLRNDQ